MAAVNGHFKQFAQSPHRKKPALRTATGLTCPGPAHSHAAWPGASCGLQDGMPALAVGTPREEVSIRQMGGASLNGPDAGQSAHSSQWRGCQTGRSLCRSDASRHTVCVCSWVLNPEISSASDALLCCCRRRSCCRWRIFQL